MSLIFSGVISRNSDLIPGGPVDSGVCHLMGALGPVARPDWRCPGSIIRRELAQAGPQASDDPERDCDGC
jgi:hypothetical protein